MSSGPLAVDLGMPVYAPRGVGHLRGADPFPVAARRALASRTYELSELLVDVLGVEDVGAAFPHRVTYHPTCHSLRLLRVGDKPL